MIRLIYRDFEIIKKKERKNNMSSYYAAYYGSGLRLNRKEFDDFLGL